MKKILFKLINSLDKTLFTPGTISLLNKLDDDWGRWVDDFQVPQED